MAENFSNDYQTTLSAAVADGVVTAINVVSATGAPDVNFRIRVGNEYMLVTSKGSGTNWTVTRGIEGSTASAHVAGTVVAHVTTTGGFQGYISEQLTGGTVAANFASLVVAGALTVSGLTAGSIPFAGVDGLISQDNSNLFWDDANKRLGIGTPTPVANLQIKGYAAQAGDLLSLVDSDGGALASFNNKGFIKTSVYRSGGNVTGMNRTDSILEFWDASGASAFDIRTDGHARFLGVNGTSFVGSALFYNGITVVGGSLTRLEANSVRIVPFPTFFRLDTVVASNRGLVILATAGQTANLQEWQIAGGSVVAAVDNVGNVSTSGYFSGVEMTAPAAPAANGYRLFAQDNGAGKTQLMVLFASGAAQQLAIQP